MRGNDRRGAKYSRFLFLGTHVAPVRDDSRAIFRPRAGSFLTSNACAIGRLLKELVVLHKENFFRQSVIALRRTSSLRFRRRSPSAKC